MSFALHDNQPTSLNTNYMGAGISACREAMSKTASDLEATKVQKIADRFFNTLLCIGYGLGAGVEGVSKIVYGIGLSVAAKLYPHRFKKDYDKNMLSLMESTMISFRVFQATFNPASLLTFAAISALPSAYDHKDESNFDTHGKPLPIGSMAKIKGHNSYLNASYFGNKINCVRENQTALENGSIELSTSKVAFSRFIACVEYLALGLLTAVEATAYLMVFLYDAIYLTLASAERSKAFLSMTDADYDRQLARFEEHGKGFLTALNIFTNAINPFMLLNIGLEHIHPDAYKIPKETLDLCATAKKVEEKEPEKVATPNPFADTTEFDD